MPSLKSGLLIAIDGIDGAGKTTQCHLIKDYFSSQNFNCIVIKEPTENGKYSDEIKKRSEKRVFDKNTPPEYELELFTKDRRENVKKNIIPNLKKGNIVIMDRYYFSTIAYQSALGINADYIREMNEEFAPVPDVTIILDVKPNVGIERIYSRGDLCDSFEEKDYLNQVRNNFLEMEEYPNLYFVEGNGDRTSAQVEEEILSIIEPIVKKKLSSKKREVVVY